MKKSTSTIVLICLVILLGFGFTTVLSYTTQKNLAEQNVSEIAQLLSADMYHQIDAAFTNPVAISLTMANDHMLQTFLQEEAASYQDDQFVAGIQNYLLDYRKQYGYDSVFLVSTATDHYYYYNGLDRTLAEEDPENEWYYGFLASDVNYALDIDNDEVASANNAINVFIDCKIKDDSGQVIGIVGVGFATDYIQNLLREYEQNYAARIYLVDQAGIIQLSTEQTGFESVSLYDTGVYGSLTDSLVLDQLTPQAFWYDAQGTHGYLTTQYVPALDWYLVLDHDTAELTQPKQLMRHSLLALAAVLIVVVLLLLKDGRKPQI